MGMRRRTMRNARRKDVPRELARDEGEEPQDDHHPCQNQDKGISPLLVPFAEGTCRKVWQTEEPNDSQGHIVSEYFEIIKKAPW
jgi:hypothetical protein